MAHPMKTCAVAAATAGILSCALAGTPADAQGQAPVHRTFQSLADSGFLSGMGTGLVSATKHESGARVWLLTSPAGAPRGVYHIRWGGTGNCIKAVHKDAAVRLAPCAGDSGKSQWWKADITPHGKTTIESGRFPGYALDVFRGVVGLERIGSYRWQKWSVGVAK